MSAGYVDVCKVDALAERPIYRVLRNVGYDRLDTQCLLDVRAPAWESLETSQRDYAAEAAGY